MTSQDADGELARRVSEFLAEGTDQSADEIEEAIEKMPMPDPLDDRPVE